jgi:uncharacterized coiled-coil protein SlyX
MGVFSKELPDELKALNLSPAEILKALNDKKDLEAKLAEKDGEIGKINTALSTQTSEFEQTKARLAALEANAQPKPKTPDPEEPIDFTQDPEGSIKQQIKNATAPVAMIALNAARNSARMEARNSLFGKTIQTPGGTIRLQTLWDRWSDEIEKAAGQMNIVTLGNSLTWMNLFNFIKGQHMEEMMAKPEVFVESVETRVDSKIGDKGTNNDKLSDEELRIAKRMKVTPEQYMEQKKKMRFSAVV